MDQNQSFLSTERVESSQPGDSYPSFVPGTSMEVSSISGLSFGQPCLFERDHLPDSYHNDTCESPSENFSSCVDVKCSRLGSFSTQINPEPRIVCSKRAYDRSVPQPPNLAQQPASSWCGYQPQGSSESLKKPVDLVQDSGDTLACLSKGSQNQEDDFLKKKSFDLPSEQKPRETHLRGHEVSKKTCRRNQKQYIRNLNHSTTNLRFNCSEIQQPLNYSDTKSGPTELEGLKEHQQDKTLGLISSKKRSTVLYVKCINPRKITVKELCNLFSSFGNVTFSMIHGNRDFGLVKFERVEDAELALKNLNKLRLFGFKLSLFYSKFQSVTRPRFTNSKEYFIPPASYYRYNSQSRDEVPSLCSSLKLQIDSNIDFKREEILRLLEAISPVASYRLGKTPLGKNSWSLAFNSKEEASIFLMKVHMTVQRGTRVKVSFATPSPHPKPSPCAPSF